METNYPKVYLYKRIVQAKMFIDENYNQAIDLDNVADEASFSKFHFIRIFKSIYQMTPHQYLISVRIKKSLQLLNCDISISEVCYRVGFESPSSFSGLFRKMTGFGPKEYLSRQQRLKLQISREPLKFIPGCHSQNSNFEEVK